MKEREARKLQEFGRCPKCGSKIEIIKSGFLVKNYSLSCSQCKETWENAKDFREEIEKYHANEFLNSDDYILMKNFAKANVGEDIDSNGYQKLSSLLELKGYKISSDMFLKIFTYELYQQKIIRLKERIGYNRNMNVDDILYSFTLNIPPRHEDPLPMIRNIMNEFDIIIEDKEGIIILKPTKFLGDYWKTANNYLSGFKAKWIRDGRKSRWEISINSRIFVQYQEEYDLLKMLLEETGMLFVEEDISKKIYHIKREIELKRFEKRLLSDKFQSININDIDALSGTEFESFLNQLFFKMGYRVEYIKGSHDQGADLILYKLGEKIAVQAKRYSSRINNQAIQEVVASLQYYNADKGWVITTNEFTQSAIELAIANKIELIDRYKLDKLIKEYY